MLLLYCPSVCNFIVHSFTYLSSCVRRFVLSLRRLNMPRRCFQVGHSYFNLRSFTVVFLFSIVQQRALLSVLACSPSKTVPHAVFVNAGRRRHGPGYSGLVSKRCFALKVSPRALFS
jgi:hypothetical protein